MLCILILGAGVFFVAKEFFDAKDNIPPPSPRLVTPHNGATGVELTASLIWQPVPNAGGYELVIGLNPGSLLKQINENLEHLWNLAEYPAHQQRQAKTYEASVT